MGPIVAVMLVLAFIYGYIANFVKLIVNFNEDVFIKAVRFVGLFIPLLGALAGFIN